MSGTWSWPDTDEPAPDAGAGQVTTRALPRPGLTVPSAARWTVEGTKTLYHSSWAGLDLVTVRPPGKEAYDHHVVRLPSAVGVVLHAPDRGVLLLNRHRFITDTEGFEIPAGGIDAGESVEQAAARETREETGWQVSSATHFLTSNASDGTSDQRFHFVYARAAGYSGPPQDAHEATSLHWIPVSDLSELLRTGRIPGALSSVALLYALQFQYI